MLASAVQYRAAVPQLTLFPHSSGVGVSGADWGNGSEAELKTVGGRGDGLTSFGVAVEAAEEASDGLTSLGATAGAADEADNEGLREDDCSLSGRLELVFVSRSGSPLFKGRASCT